MALDILPIPATSVPCERLFSRCKEASDDRRSRIDPATFEYMACLNNHWRSTLVDYARMNEEEMEEVMDLGMDDFKDLLLLEEEIQEWDL